MAKRAKRRVEAVRAFGQENMRGRLLAWACRTDVEGNFPIRVRILRETHYKALLKAAREAK